LVEPETKTKPEIFKSIEENRIKIQDVLASKGRVKLLVLLSKVGELNISELAKRCKLNHNTASFHLEKLQDMGLLQKKVFGRIKVFRWKNELPKMRALKTLFELWES
jgi:predicted transcriptional regulator